MMLLSVFIKEEDVVEDDTDDAEGGRCGVVCVRCSCCCGCICEVTIDAEVSVNLLLSFFGGFNKLLSVPKPNVDVEDWR